MLVQDALRRSSELDPAKIALVCQNRRISYAEFDHMSNRLAHALQNAGVRRGDRIAIYLANSIEAAVSIFAVLKAGAVFVPINRSTAAPKLSFLLDNSQAFGLITDSAAVSQGTVATVGRDNPQLGVIIVCGPAVAAASEPATRSAVLSFDRCLAAFPPTPPPNSCIDLDLACLIYTSGSTGEPKGVMTSHSNMMFVTGSIVGYLQNTAADTVLNVLPLSFGYGLYQLIASVLAGGTLVLEASFAFPAMLLDRIASERVTGFPGVPTIYATFLQMNLDSYDLSSLRYITNAAAPLPLVHILELRRRLPSVAIFSMYGLTETTRTLYMPPERLDSRPGSVGIAIPGTEAWVESPEGVRLGPDQVGELVVRGRHVMRGYWRAPIETAERFRPGPLPGEQLCYTGDLFRTDQDGYFYFVARKDDIIKTRGEKVAPKEVENAICSLPGVVEAAVVGVPDDILGQAVKAVVVADQARVTKAAILAHCRSRLEDFMIPKYVEFQSELPKTLTGKVVKRGLA